MNWKALLFVALIAFGAYQHFQQREVVHGNGVVAPEEPQQRNLDTAEVQNINGYSVTPLATYRIEARVLASKAYYAGREADLSPIDWALGWGPMSDEQVLNQIEISQGNRFYFWHVDAFPIPRDEIETNSANVHIIPENSTIEDHLGSVRVGNVVELEGYLVEAKADDGWRWKSSLTRNDTGNGACEILLVKSLKILQ